MIWTVTRHAYIASEVGDRIRRLRQTRGWTQSQFAERIGCSRRAVLYYERDGKYPPAPILAAMAGAFDLDITALIAPDEPASRRSRDEPDLLSDPDDRRLWKKFRQLKQLNDRDQQAVFRMITAMVDAK